MGGHTLKAKMQIALVAAHGEGGRIYQDADGAWHAIADDMDAPSEVEPLVLKALLLGGHLAPTGPKSYGLTQQANRVVELLKQDR